MKTVLAVALLVVLAFMLLELVRKANATPPLACLSFVNHSLICE